jgi:hypothetical protein
MLHFWVNRQELALIKSLQIKTITLGEQVFRNLFEAPETMFDMKSRVQEKITVHLDPQISIL